MRIEIDDEHPFSDRGERGSEIDGGRGFADPAFLIGKHEYAHGGGRHLVLLKKPSYLFVYGAFHRCAVSIAKSRYDRNGRPNKVVS